MKRALWIGLALLVIIGVGAPYLDADFIKPRIERALERGLGRRVTVEKAYFSLFRGPGFTLENVVIHEDPRAGIEPFARVGKLEARVRLLAVLSRHLDFSTLRLSQGRLGEGTIINLVKTDAGPWNFQFLLGSAPAIAGSMPAIEMRSGRVNFKFGDTKSVFYFNDADLDVSPSDNGSVGLRFGGAPSRTDQAAQSFGHFFVRGSWSAQRVDMRVELERSSVEEVARLFDQHGFGLHGVLAFDAQLAGRPSNLEINGQLQIDDVHRWDLLPKRGGGWSVGYKGKIDLHDDRLELASVSDTPDAPLALQFRLWDFLSRPQWDAAADVKQVPLATLLEIARHMGAPISEKLSAEGSVSGSVRYGLPDGLSGRFELQNASIALPEAQPVRAQTATVSIAGKSISLDPAKVQIGENEAAEIEGSFETAAGLDLKITARNLSVTDIRSFGLSSIPVLEQTAQGTWRGWARYRWTPGAAGEWSGEYDLQNARIAVDGLADPVRIQSASVVAAVGRISVNRLRARIGDIALTGDYRWEPAAIRPHKFHFTIPEADAAEIERLCAPVLVHERGFLARTLRLAPAPVPDWLKSRRADGTLVIARLTLGDTRASISSARLLWDGALLRVAHLDAQVNQPDADPAEVTGELAIDLSAYAPRYRFDGKLRDLAYKGGTLDFDGSAEAEGAGVQLLLGAHGQGSFRGRSISFNPDAEFQTVAGCFDLLPGAHWKVSCLDVVQAGETYAGTGATQPDGRLVLDLTNRGRQIRYTGTLTALAAPQ
jgi:hypothetical protein